MVYGTSDDSRIIIDEVAGAMLALLIARPVLPVTVTLVAALYLILDGLKHWPLAAVEDLPGGFGVMGDDLVAGALVGLVVLGVRLSGLPTRLQGGR